MGMFGQGGFFSKPVGRSILGSIGDGLLLASGNKPMYWPQQAEANQEGLTLARQLALAQYKAAHPDQTALMTNAAAAGFQPGTPGYQKFIQDNVNPFRFMIYGDPTQGGYMIPTNGGGAAGAAPQTRQIGDKTYYNINGEWYDNPEGR